MAGLIQGAAWYHGEGVYKTLPQIAIFMVLRAMLGLFIIAGAVIGLWNAILTLRRGEPLGGLCAGRRCESMKMTPALVVIGSLLVFWSSVIIAIVLPAMTIDEQPSDLWRPWSAKEAAGHDLYVRNGCSYCHSQFVRVVDSDLGAERIAQKGDYVGYTPAILGTDAHGSGPLAGRRRASRRLAGRAFHEPALHAADVADALVGIPRPGSH